MRKKRAALYIRVSSDEQAKHGFSLPEQRRDLTEYAKNKGYDIVDMYADEGSTARKALSRRHGLHRLLKDVRAGRIDIIVMKCLDRWFRNIRDYYNVQDILDEHHVEWECTQEDYNTTTTNGRLMLNLKLSIAQNESDQTSDRIKYVFDGIKRTPGRALSIPPIGYKIVARGHEKFFELDEQMIPLVKFVFAHVLSGKSIYSCTSAVKNEFNISLTRCRIHGMLTRSAYIGTMYGVENYCPPIISESDFNRVQELISAQPRPVSSGRIYLFSGLIKCPSCGLNLSGYRGCKNSAGEYIWPSYRCNNHYTQQSAECDYTSAISEARIERYLLTHIRDLIRDYVCTIKHVAHTNTGKRELASLKAKFERVKSLYIDGMIEKDEFDSTANPLKERIRELEKVQHKLHAVTPRAIEVMNSNNFLDVYQKLSREKKRDLWHNIIRSITFENKPLKRGSSLDFSIEFSD